MEKKTRGRPRGGGSTLQRTETVTIRLDPESRYLADLAARVQRRTTSSFIEWSLQQTLAQVALDDGTPAPLSIKDAAPYLWDPDEADRLVRLALYHPRLLTYAEQVLWKLIQECSWLWHDGTPPALRPGTLPPRGEPLHLPVHAHLHIERLRTSWETLKSVASGEADRSSLARFAQQDPAPPTATPRKKGAPRA